MGGNSFYFLIFCFNVDLIFCDIYNKYVIEDGDVCSPLPKKQKLPMSKDGLIISQTRLNDHSVDWNQNLTCDFKVKVGNLLTKFQIQQPDGLIAVVQRLSLRQNATTGECIDFIQFKTEHSESERFCRSVPDINGNFIHMYSYNGKLETKIFIDRRKLDGNQEMDLLIVYTVTKQPCSTENNAYFKCSNKPFCIRSEFKNDKYFNCPNCSDEDNCRSKIIKYSSGIGTIATIAASSMLLSAFIFFLISIWLCKKFKVLYWKPSSSALVLDRVTFPGQLYEDSSVSAAGMTSTPSAPHYVNSSSPAGSLEQRNTFAHVTSNSHSAAQLLEQRNSFANMTSNNDKDLPPSYESLFPSDR